jgi:hypothetical protein
LGVPDTLFQKKGRTQRSAQIASDNIERYA